MDLMLVQDHWRDMCIVIVLAVVPILIILCQLMFVCRELTQRTKQRDLCYLFLQKTSTEDKFISFCVEHHHQNEVAKVRSQYSLHKSGYDGLY